MKKCLIFTALLCACMSLTPTQTPTPPDWYGDTVPLYPLGPGGYTTILTGVSCTSCGSAYFHADMTVDNVTVPASGIKDFWITNTDTNNQVKPGPDDGKFSILVSNSGNNLLKQSDIVWFRWIGTMNNGSNWFSTGGPLAKNKDIFNNIKSGETYYLQLSFVYRKRDIVIKIPIVLKSE